MAGTELAEVAGRGLGASDRVWSVPDRVGPQLGRLLRSGKASCAEPGARSKLGCEQQ